MFAGLGMATKYYSVVLIPTIFLAHIFYIKKSKLSVIKNIINKKSVIAALSLLCAFFIASPYNFLDPLGLDQTIIIPLKKIMSTGGQSTKVTAGVGSLESRGFVFVKSLGHYLSVVMSPRAMGEIGIIALFGLTFFLVRLSPVNIITISFPVLFILVANMLGPFYSEYRHLNPIYPFMTVLAAYSINYMYELLQHKTKLSRLFFIGSILILVTPAFYRVVKHDYLLTRPNTKTLAKEWIEANIPSGTMIVLDEAAVKISPDKKHYEELLRRFEGYKRGQFTTHADKLYNYSLKALPDVTYDIAYIRFPWWQEKEKVSGVHFADSDYDKDMANPLKPVGVMPLEYYKKQGYKYAIVTSELYGDFFKQNSTKALNFPSFYAFYKSLFEEATLVKEFKPDPWNSRGSVIRIFEIG